MNTTNMADAKSKFICAVHNVGAGGCSEYGSIIHNLATPYNDKRFEQLRRRNERSEYLFEKIVNHY